MPEIPFFRLLAVPVNDKGEALREQVCALNGEGIADATGQNDLPGETFAVDPTDFGQIPGSPFAYWVGESIRRLFVTLPCVEGQFYARQGMVTADDFRFVRDWWEVTPNSIGYTLEDTFTGCRWAHFAKGGAYSLFYYDVHLVVDWENEGERIRNFFKPDGRLASRPQNIEYFFRFGLTWPRRTTSGISIRIMPDGCVFADKGPAVFVPNDEVEVLLALLAAMNSTPFEALVKLHLGAATAAARSYEVGVIQRTPIPDLYNLQPAIRRRLAGLAQAAHDLQRDRDRSDETTHAFCLPGLVSRRDAPTLWEAGLRLDAEEQARQVRLAQIQAEIDALVFDLYGLSESDRILVLREMGKELTTDDLRLTIDDSPLPEDASEIVNQKSEIENEDDGVAPPEDLPARVANLLMWCVGVAFGRWDLRKALDPTLLPPLGGPFDPLPRQAPGALDLRLAIDDLRLESADSKIANRQSEIENGDDLQLPEGAAEILNRQSEIVNQGILPDDPHHPDDLVGRVQAILRVLYGERAQAIEAEACAVLGFDSLRAYFRDPRKGFFAFHIKRYSKSRRKAPIYWLLQSERRNYGIWLYSHRLEKYALYSAARDYADFKVNFEQGRLDDLKESLSQIEGAERRRRERELARQQQLVDEVRAFRQRLDAVAKQDLFIDLNDGVLISIAPLRELVPWKEAERMWEQLLAGEYGWSTMARMLREKGLVAKT